MNPGLFGQREEHDQFLRIVHGDDLIPQMDQLMLDHVDDAFIVVHDDDCALARLHLFHSRSTAASFSGGRQKDIENGTFARFRIYGDQAAVALDDMKGTGEPETAALGLGGKVGVEYPA